MKTLILMIPIILLLSSCGSQKQLQENTNTELSSIQLNDIWALVAVDGKDLDFSDTLIYQPALELHLKDSMAIGTTDCNNFRTKMKLNGDRISFPPFPMTMRYCPGYENVFVKGIGNTASYRIEGLKLYFYDKDGKEVLRFKKVD